MEQRVKRYGFWHDKEWEGQPGEFEEMPEGPYVRYEALAEANQRARVAERALENAANELSAWGTEMISAIYNSHIQKAEQELAAEGAVSGFPIDKTDEWEARQDAKKLPYIDFDAIRQCSSCSEKWGICGAHQKQFGVNYKGEGAVRGESES